MTNTTNTPAAKIRKPRAAKRATAFDVREAVQIAAQAMASDDKMEAASKTFENAKKRRETLVKMFADVNRAAGFRNFDHLLPEYKDRKEGKYRQEFLDTLAASYLKPDQLAVYKDFEGVNAVLATRDPATKKQITSPRGELVKMINQFVARLIKAAEPFIAETVAQKKKREKEEAKIASGDAPKKVNKTLEQFSNEQVASILKRIINDAKQTEPSYDKHKEFQTYMKKVQKEVQAFFA
jgi:hypothetical protein